MALPVLPSRRGARYVPAECFVGDKFTDRVRTAGESKFFSLNPEVRMRSGKLCAFLRCL